MKGSPILKLSNDDLYKIAKGAGIAAAGVVLTWLGTTVVPILNDGGSIQEVINASNGLWQLTLAAALSVVVNSIRKLFTDTRSGADVIPPAEKS